MVAAAVSHYGRLDYAVNNAAVVRFAPITAATQESSTCISTPICAAFSTA